MARVDRRQPGAEQDERAGLAVVVGQDHRMGALVRGQRGDHPLHGRDELRPADLVRRSGTAAGSEVWRTSATGRIGSVSSTISAPEARRPRRTPTA